MVAADKAIACFTGVWGYLNATTTNITSGELLPAWQGVYPSGMTMYTPNGYLNFVITANDTTQAYDRPAGLTLPAQAGDNQTAWAVVAQHGLSAGGIWDASNVTLPASGALAGLPNGVLKTSFSTATLPSWVGLGLTSEFQFLDNCNAHVLSTYYSADVVQVVYFGRLQDHLKFNGQAAQAAQSGYAGQPGNAGYAGQAGQAGQPAQAAQAAQAGQGAYGRWKNAQ